MKYAHLNLSTSEKWIVKSHRRFDGIFVDKFDVGETFRRSVKFVAEDRDAVDGAAAVKMLFKFFSGGTVVHVTDVHGPASVEFDWLKKGVNHNKKCQKK